MIMVVDFTSIEDEVVGYDFENAIVANGQVVKRDIIFREFIGPYLDDTITPSEVHTNLWNLLIEDLTSTQKPNCEYLNLGLEKRRMIMNSMILIEKNYDLSTR